MQKVSLPSPQENDWLRLRLAGFTLAELLIALAILGVIASFTIPKLLQSQREERYNAIAKEAIATISQAFETAKLNGSLTNTMNGWAFTQYMNYTAVLPGGTVMDERPNFGTTTFNCGANSCIRLHNGAVLTPYASSTFSSTSASCPPTGYVDFTLDPDGINSGTPNSLRLMLSYSGRVGTRAYSCGGTNNPVDDPSWFHF